MPSLETNCNLFYFKFLAVLKSVDLLKGCCDWPFPQFNMPCMEASTRHLHRPLARSSLRVIEAWISSLNMKVNSRNTTMPFGCRA